MLQTRQTGSSQSYTQAVPRPQAADLRSVRYVCENAEFSSRRQRKLRHSKRAGIANRHCGQRPWPVHVTLARCWQLEGRRWRRATADDESCKICPAQRMRDQRCVAPISRSSLSAPRCWSQIGLGRQSCSSHPLLHWRLQVLPALEQRTRGQFDGNLTFISCRVAVRWCRRGRSWKAAASKMAQPAGSPNKPRQRRWPCCFAAGRAATELKHWHSNLEVQEEMKWACSHSRFALDGSSPAASCFPSTASTARSGNCWRGHSSTCMCSSSSCTSVVIVIMCGRSRVTINRQQVAAAARTAPERWRNAER